MSNPITMMATGELILGMSEPSPEFYFDLVAPALKSADLVIGHLEVPHTDRPEPSGEIMTAATTPDNMLGLPYAGFSAVTFAGNPTFSYGTPGIVDTMEWLNKHDIAVVGAGLNIDEARRPIILERGGVKFGVLSYNCVGQKASAASYSKSGCAYVDVITHYEPTMFPGGDPVIYTFAEPKSLEAMREDIRALRPLCDVLVVAIHKGSAMTEIELKDYEFEICYAAIDNGADIILGNHTHVLRGIEFYKDKPIFHCLSNLVTVFKWESHKMFKEEPKTTLNQSRLRPASGHNRAWMDLEYPVSPFKAISRKAIMAKLVFDGSKLTRISYLPMLINKQGQPEILKHDERGQDIFDYMEKITRGAGLNAHYAWDGDEVVVTPE